MQQHHSKTGVLKLNVRMDSGAILNKTALLFFATKFGWKARSPPHSDLISKNFKSEERKMAYNKAREEQKWKQWKEKEEEKLRACGMEEDSIQKLRDSDWKDFKAERIYQDHRADYPEYSQWENVKPAEPDIVKADALLDAISDEKIFSILKGTDKKTLQIILLKMLGFSINEISKEMGIPPKTIYTRMDRLKKKIKKFSESEEKRGSSVAIK